MKRLGNAARKVPQPAKDGEGNELLGAEVALHVFKGVVVIFCCHICHLLGPADGGLFFGAEKIAIFPTVAIHQVDLILGDAVSPTELDVVPESVVALC
jgi:hypothetical protein